MAAEGLVDLRIEFRTRVLGQPCRERPNAYSCGEPTRVIWPICMMMFRMPAARVSWELVDMLVDRHWKNMEHYYNTEVHFTILSVEFGPVTVRVTPVEGDGDGDAVRED